MSGSSKNNLSDYKTFLNKHNFILIFGIIILIIGFLGLISLCGIQTNSCTTSGLGSFVESSTGGEEDGQINTTAEVIGEFLIVLFVIVGVAMIAYVVTLNGVTDKLIKKNELYAAVVVNGNKSLTKTDVENLKKEQVQYLVTDIGLPSNTISEGLKALNKAATAVKNTYNKKAGAQRPLPMNNVDSDTGSSSSSDDQ